MKFDELEIEDKLKNAIADIGFTELTPIQEKAVPYGLAGRDITGLAQTGTGKTLAFLIPIINKLIRDNLKSPCALILAPTRELVVQICDEATRILTNTDFKAAPIIGGTGYKEQEREMLDASILVATPGRLIDHLKNGKVDLSHISFFVLDEADRMFDMGFIKDIRFVMKKCPVEKQTMLFSATLSYYVVRLASDYLNDPVEIQIEPEKITTENIDQKLIHLGKDEKLPYLTNLILNDQGEGLGIIFTNLKVLVPEIVSGLRHFGIHATGISSLLDQKKRIRLMKDFKLGKYKYMVATDVASRGIDVENINVVYNYDLPGDSENYVHRIGRTARAGRKGRSISFCSELDYTELEKIEKFMNQKIEVTNVEEEFLKFPEGNFEKYEVQGEKDFKPGIKKDFHRNGNGNKKFGGKSSRPDRGNFNKKPQHHVARKEGNSSSGGRRPINQLEEAKLYLEKANSVSELLPAKPSVKEKPHREHKEKFSNKKHHPVKHKVKEKTKYDKSKRNLFDINDPVKIETKKTFSIWKKIKSLFGD